MSGENKKVYPRIDMGSIFLSKNLGNRKYSCHIQKKGGDFYDELERTE